MKINHRVLLVLLQIFCEALCENTTSNSLDENGSAKVLSRKKRFLIFPDGSSLQLVFCVQTAALIPIGDIFLYGSTAALAWNLPSDPKLFHMLTAHDKKALRRGDFRNHIYYVDENGKLLSRVPYKRSHIVNPAFGKRSIDETTFRDKLKARIERLKMHERQKTRDYLKKDHMDPDTIDFHRTSRAGLFEKMEKLFTALGQDGRQCVLLKLCEAARPPPHQGTFLQEILRAVFTLPKGSPFDSEDHQEYDSAHTPADDCALKYPGCDNLQLPTHF